MPIVIRPNASIAIVISSAANDDALRHVAEDAGVAVFPSISEARTHAAQYILHREAHGLELLGPDEKPGTGVRSDFAALDIRTGAGNCSRQQPLGRAIGKQSLAVIDATAGLGYDTILLACMGCRVTAIERSPIVAALLEDGLARARNLPGWPEIVDRVVVRTGDAKNILRQLDTNPDAVYIDPMFPPKRKAALPPKRIRVVREIVGDDEDAADLLHMARQRSRRVVVKRPSHAPPIAEDRSHTVKTKMVRYDVYIQAEADSPRRATEGHGAEQ